jgi:hypothetical protein
MSVRAAPGCELLTVPISGTGNCACGITPRKSRTVEEAGSVRRIYAAAFIYPPLT